MKQRNPEATCATCPWWEREGVSDSGTCHGMPKHEIKPAWQYCSLHPEALLEETPDA